MYKSALVFLIVIQSISSSAQTLKKTISISDAVNIALTNSPLAKNAELSVQSAKGGNLSFVNLGATEINYLSGQLYSATNDHFWEIEQHLGSPLTHIQNVKYKKQAVIVSENEQKLTIKKLTADVKTLYINFLYQYSRLKAFNNLNISYNALLSISGLPYNQSDSNELSKITAETRFADFQNSLFQAEQDYHLAGNQLQQLLNIQEELVPSDSSLELYAIEILNSGPDKFYPKSQISFYNESAILYQKGLSLEQSKLFPEVAVGYFNHGINNLKSFQGIKVGINVPIWYFPQKARINEARINQKIAMNELEYQKFNITKTIENLKIQLDKSYVIFSFYRENALKKADLLLQMANSQIQSKSNDYSSIYSNLETVLKIQLEYLNAVKQYNQFAIQLEFYVD
jgi:cobalt-zinc-cadmium resistance protein CzcA